MSDPGLSEAIAEAYASAAVMDDETGQPVEQVILHTIELRHPAFTAPIRVVRDHKAIEARLEPSAEEGAVVVEFTPFAFDFKPPEQTSNGLPQCVIEIDNVSRVLVDQIDAAVMDGRTVQVIYRAYLDDRLLDGPDTDPPLVMSLSSIYADPMRIRATAGFPDLLNRMFPATDYDMERFPGLLL